jgi:hypothetical protein
VKYIKTLNCTKSYHKVKDFDYEIRLYDGIGSYMYSIQISKNQIFVYNDGTDLDISLYDYKDAKFISELARLYKDMSYKEVLIMGK